MLSAIVPTAIFAADTLSFRVRQTGNWAFYGTQEPVVDMVVSNSRGIPESYSLSCTIKGYAGNPLFRLQQGGVAAPKDSVGVSFSFLTMEPGFYNAEVANSGRVAKGVNIAYEPEKISSQVFAGRGGKGDFALFADMVALERRDISPQFSIVRNKALSGREKNVYDFRMVSRGDEAVAGYMAFPRGKSGLAVMVSLVMEDEASSNPLADFTAPQDMAELVLYLHGRGEGEEYLKNLLTDIFLGIDFVAQRSETDISRIYIQGSGEAAACSFVAGVMDERIAVSFVADPDFSMFTGHFSVESLASKGDNPVLFGLSLQQDTFSLQEIFCIYNSTESRKEYFMFPDRNSVERKQWLYVRDSFLKRLGM